MTVPLLIIGVPRSGTTFLLSELSKHTDLLPLSEPVRFYESYRCNPISIYGRVKPLRLISRKLNRTTPTTDSIKKFTSSLEKSQTNYLIKETFRSHSYSDNPTQYIYEFAKRSPQRIICIKRSPYEVIQSVMNRGDNTLLSNQLVRELTCNIMNLNDFARANNLYCIDYTELLKNKSKCIQAILNKFPLLLTNSEKVKYGRILGTGDQLALNNKPLSARNKSHVLSEEYKAIISSILDE